MKLAVLVPRPGTQLARRVAPGSGMVGSPAEGRPGYVVVDFEGNIYGCETVRTFADRVFHAAARHVRLVPTVARAVVPESDVIQVGEFDLVQQSLRIDDQATLEQWLGVHKVPDDELRITRP